MSGLDWLGPVKEINAQCVVADDPGSVVRPARPMTDEDRAVLREQAIARMQADPDAVRRRERRIAIERGSALVFQRRRA